LSPVGVSALTQTNRGPLVIDGEARGTQRAVRERRVELILAVLQRLQVPLGHRREPSAQLVEVRVVDRPQQPRGRHHRIPVAEDDPISPVQRSTSSSPSTLSRGTKPTFARVQW
jgi:hypothetical protein